MPYKEIDCHFCKGTGKVSLSGKAGAQVMCLFCVGEGKLKKWFEAYTEEDVEKTNRDFEQVDPQDEKEKQMIARLDLMMKQKIKDSKRRGEIADERAKKLEAWWQEFVEIFKLPLVKRAGPLQEVLLKGLTEFRDVPMFAAMMEALSGKKLSETGRPSNVCPTCSGTGRGTECWKCKGSGTLVSRMRSPWGGGYIDQTFTCDHCYGRGYDVCPSCGGRKTRY